MTYSLLESRVTPELTKLNVSGSVKRDNAMIIGVKRIVDINNWNLSVLSIFIFSFTDIIFVAKNVVTIHAKIPAAVKTKGKRKEASEHNV
jgi:hypothetical protein